MMALIPIAMCVGVFAHFHRNGFVAFLGGTMGCGLLTTPLGFTIDRVAPALYKSRTGCRRQVSPEKREGPLGESSRTNDKAGQRCSRLLCDLGRIWAKGLANIAFLVFVVISRTWSVS